jgi:hypothetical protein
MPRGRQARPAARRSGGRFPRCRGPTKGIHTRCEKTLSPFKRLPEIRFIYKLVKGLLGESVVEVCRPRARLETIFPDPFLRDAYVHQFGRYRRLGAATRHI